MTLPIQLELTATGVRASTNGTAALSADAATIDDALRALRLAYQATNGAPRPTNDPHPSAESSPEDPMRRFAGIWKDDPYIDDYLKAVAEYRQQVEEDPRWQ